MEYSQKLKMKGTVHINKTENNNPLISYIYYYEIGRMCTFFGTLSTGTQDFHLSSFLHYGTLI